MASTYINNLRLNEMGTGDQSGTWGTVTNTNLELIGEALGYGAQTLSDASTATSNVSDGSSAEARAMYLKYSGTLSATCTITITPNTMKRVQIIENATSGGQSIIIKQGSGATVTIPNGTSKICVLDGAGAGAAVIEALENLVIGGDLTIGGDDLKMGTNTSGHLLVADGTNFNPVAMSGDATIGANGALTIANDAVGADELASNAVVNASIASGAAIAFSKLADLTASRALVSDSNGDVSVSAVTSTELGYLDGVSSAIQTQLNAKGTSSFSGSYTDLSNKPTIPTNNNQLTNGAGYLTSSTLASSYASSSTSGYIRFANGFQMCWARQTTSFSGTWTFPLAFPNACVGVSKHDERSSSSGNGENYVYNISASSVAYTSGDTGSKTLIAVGY